MKNKSHIYDINRPRFRHGRKYSKYRNCLIMTMLICVKQHLSIIWSLKFEFMKKLSNTEAELKKSVAYKKRV